jgi:hypothetical protein
MKQKHPPASQSIRWEELRPISSAAAPVIEDDCVRKAVRSFPRESAGGLFGLRPQHLKDAMIPGFEDELVRQLTVVVNILVCGEAPAEIRPFLCCVSLAALPKHDGGHRPIAVGEVLRRLVGKCLASTSREDAQSLLEPIQVGVGTSGGCEAVVHVVRKWFRVHADDRHRLMAKIDLANAFNTVERHALLEAVRIFMPGLAPWVDWTHGHDTFLMLDREELASVRGVQQGDPLGPLLFSLALHRAVSSVKQHIADCPGSFDFVVFYLDDGIISGSDEAVSWFWQRLEGELAKIGLQANVGKCEATPSCGQDSLADPSLLPGWKWAIPVSARL